MNDDLLGAKSCVLLLNRPFTLAGKRFRVEKQGLLGHV